MQNLYFFFKFLVTQSVERSCEPLPHPRKQLLTSEGAIIDNNRVQDNRKLHTTQLFTTQTNRFHYFYCIRCTMSMLNINKMLLNYFKTQCVKVKLNGDSGRVGESHFNSDGQSFIDSNFVLFIVLVGGAHFRSRSHGVARGRGLVRAGGARRGRGRREGRTAGGPATDAADRNAIVGELARHFFFSILVKQVSYTTCIVRIPPFFERSNGLSNLYSRCKVSLKFGQVLTQMSCIRFHNFIYALSNFTQPPSIVHST